MAFFFFGFGDTHTHTHRTNKRTNERTSKQANKQTHKPTHTNKTNKQSHTNNHTHTHTHSHTHTNTHRSGQPKLSIMISHPAGFRLACNIAAKILGNPVRLLSLSLKLLAKQMPRWSQQWHVSLSPSQRQTHLNSNPSCRGSAESYSQRSNAFLV